ncbi:MAG: signal peptidase II [Firmicutes bacterium]|nr:signal peptidase II [Bacillota bacterium]
MTILKPSKVKFAFLLPWLLYLLLELITGGRIFTASGILPLAFLWLAGGLTELAAMKIPRPTLPRTRLLFFSLGLAIIDQICKLLVVHYLQDQTIPLIPGFSLQQVHNMQAAWIPNRLGWDIPLAILSLAAVLILFLTWCVYSYYTGALKRRNVYTDLALILIFGGALSALVDQTLRGFTVDFITFQGFFTADLKDFYLTLGWAAVIAEAMQSPIPEPPLREFPSLLLRMIRHTLGK